MKVALFYICSSYVKYWPIFIIFDVMKQEVTSDIIVIYLTTKWNAQTMHVTSSQFIATESHKTAEHK